MLIKIFSKTVRSSGKYIENIKLEILIGKLIYFATKVILFYQ